MEFTIPPHLHPDPQPVIITSQSNSGVHDGCLRILHPDGRVHRIWSKNERRFITPSTSTFTDTTTNELQFKLSTPSVINLLKRTRREDLNGTDQRILRNLDILYDAQWICSRILWDWVYQ